MSCRRSSSDHYDVAEPRRRKGSACGLARFQSQSEKRVDAGRIDSETEVSGLADGTTQRNPGGAARLNPEELSRCWPKESLFRIAKHQTKIERFLRRLTPVRGGLPRIVPWCARAVGGTRDRSCAWRRSSRPRQCNTPFASRRLLPRNLN